VEREVNSGEKVGAGSFLTPGTCLLASAFSAPDRGLPDNDLGLVVSLRRLALILLYYFAVFHFCLHLNPHCRGARATRAILDARDMPRCFWPLGLGF